MKAAIRRRYGTPKMISVENFQKPEPGNAELLIRVHTTTVNRTDCANLTGKPFIMKLMLGLSAPRKIVMGTDFAGDILALGSSISEFKVGQRVFGFVDMGAESQAEYLIINKRNVFKTPEEVNFVEAVASLEGAHYAYSFFKKANVQDGDRVLINGATGAIGSALLQFVRHKNVFIAVSCRPGDEELVKRLGAHKVYDYTKVDFTEANETYDYIFDTVGKSTFGKCKPLLAKKGIYISSELGPNSQNIFYSLKGLVTSGKKVVFPIPFPTSESIPFIIEQLEKKNFHPVIDRKYPLARVSEAYEYVISGQKTGNVVLNIQ